MTIKTVIFLFLWLVISPAKEKSLLKENVAIELHYYEHEGEMKVSAMPVLRPDSELMSYKRRFEYLLINIPEIHLPGQFEARVRINSLYPDTMEIKRRYLDKYLYDKKLEQYFIQTYAPLKNADYKRNESYSLDELMEVASRFFYCNKVESDTSVQAYVCVGLNGVKEANWKRDFTLLEAFCYESIFNGFDREESPVWEAFVSNKEYACNHYKARFNGFDQYLEDVRLDLFERMRADEALKRELLEYYELNRKNLSFVLVY